MLERLPGRAPIAACCLILFSLLPVTARAQALVGTISRAGMLPTAVAVWEAGNRVFIADSGARQIHAYTSDTLQYVRSTPVLSAEDGQGKVLAFVNLIPSYRRGESTIDLMRRRTEAPNGIMDYVFVKLFLLKKGQGLERFNLGMAPMAGFQEQEEASPEERAIHAFFQQLNFLFSFKGLLAYKAKFASSWEPRYVVYRSALDLPRLVWALSKVSELPD